MRYFNVPYAGPVEDRILRFLYYNRDHGFIITKVIESKIHKEHVYNSLQALCRRDYVLKRYINKKKCVWCLNPDKIKKIEIELQIPIEQEDTRRLLEAGLKTLAYYTPFVREIYCAYKLADIVYSSWNLIEKNQVTYQEEGLRGIRKAAGYDATKDIVLYAIRDRITPDDKETSKEVLSTFMDNITNREIEYVKQFF